MRKIIDDNDLGIPYTNRVNRTIIDFIKVALGLNKLNLLYDKLYDKKGVEFARGLITEIGVECAVLDGSIENIPESGAFIAIANHPHGALDGLILANLILRRRSDTKFMGNFLLEKVEPMSDMFLAVNPFNSKASRNVPAIRAAINHLKQGKGLVIFPAGEVSTYYNGFKICEDKEWDNSIVKFIRSANVPVVPVYISGKNSLKFHLVGKINPVLRTVRLPLELLNKSGKHVDVVIGSSISVKRQSELSSLAQYRDYLRANIYFMMNMTKNKSGASQQLSQQEIAPAVEQRRISEEILHLKPTSKLFSLGEFTVYCCISDEIPITIKEIARLREATFRKIGEGTNKSEDRDGYDQYYRHLFIWNNVESHLVGAYRVGFGADILKEYGIDGFYTNTLFEYSSKFASILGDSIELGRSFIIPEYQKRTKPLMMLWRGILTILLQNPEYKYLLGPVSMSGSYSSVAKLITINYIKEHHWNGELAKMVIARNGVKQFQNGKINTKLLQNIKEIGLIDKLIVDLDVDKTPLPVLLRKYLQLGGVVLSFNVDANFNDSLDALLLLDITKVPQQTLEMLGKEYDLNVVNRRFSK